MTPSSRFRSALWGLFVVVGKAFGRPSATCSHPSDQAGARLGASRFDQAQGRDRCAVACLIGVTIIAILVAI